MLIASEGVIYNWINHDGIETEADATTTFLRKPRKNQENLNPVEETQNETVLRSTGRKEKTKFKKPFPANNFKNNRFTFSN